MTDNIQPVTSFPVKRKKVDLNFQLCILCQLHKAESLSNGSQQGTNKIKESFEIRAACKDISYSDIIDLLSPYISNLLDNKPRWHKSCYATFTSKVNLQSIQDRSTKKENTDSLRPSTSSKVVLTRHAVQDVDWAKCIFCQKRKKTEKVHQVQSVDVKDAFHQFTEHDYSLKCKIGVSDLIMSKAHYHNTCKLKAQRDYANATEKDELQLDFSTSAFDRLISMLDDGFKKGHVYSMDDICSKYSQLLSETGREDTGCRSHRLKDKLFNYYGEKICFRRQRNRNQPLLVFPAVSSGEAIEALKIATENLQETEMVNTGINESPSSPFLKSLLHVATKINADLKATPGHVGFDNLTRNAAEKCIPDTLYMLIKWIITPPEDTDIDDSNNTEKDCDEKHHQNILQLCENFVYAASNGRKNTPKHIGTGLLVHHATRSRQLIDFLHSSGDSISYDTVQRITTSIAEKELSRWAENNNTYIPKNLVQSRFTQFAADNFDIVEETLDGKGTFHVTQMAAFQRGPPNQYNLDEMCTSRNKSLSDVPPTFHELATSDNPIQQVPPQFPYPPDIEKMVTPLVNLHSYICKNIAWMLSRLEHSGNQKIPAWTGFNQIVSQVCPQVTTIGYLPIIKAPAHDLDTILTVLLRCKAIATQMNLPNTVVTLDEALYWKAKELQWANPETLAGVIVRLGGFHTAKNFSSIIGKHMEKSGLSDVWIYSGLYSECTAEKILAGKSWNRAIRAHKLTLEALSRLYLSSFKQWQDQKGKTSYIKCSKLAKDFGTYININQREDTKNALNNFLQCLEPFLNDMQEFNNEMKTNATFVFWKQYMDMVQILLCFILAEREGNWLLHISTFQEMLPFMVIYDHVNYTRYGIIYLADMLALPDTAPYVYKEFMEGNFVVKETEALFNQLSPDMALEHINKLCKISGGIVGITRSNAALNRWMLTCCDLSRLAEDIQIKAGLNSIDNYSGKDTGEARIARDEKDVQVILDQLKLFNPFGQDTEDLLCISTNDVAPSDITEDLLTVQQRGKKKMREILENRLGENPQQPFRSVLKKNKSKTFSSMHLIQVKTSTGQSSTIKADRDLFKRLFSAVTSGRTVNVSMLLTHELASVPLSLASFDRNLRPTDKAVLSHILTDSLKHTELPPSSTRTSTLIDGMALVQAIGKPTTAKTFGDLANIFCISVFKHFSETCKRIDLIFDTYRQKSIKANTRERRTSKNRKIRRIIDTGSVQIPTSWSDFIGLPENKINLVKFLTKELLRQCGHLTDDQELVIAGGCETPDLVVSSVTGILHHLCSTHEEADTRIVLHANDAVSKGYERLIVYSRDTDVLLLLIHHVTAEVWMVAGTKQKPKYFPVHQIRESLNPQVCRNLLAYHAITGCDSTSQFSGYGKRKTWTTYTSQPDLLNTFMDCSSTGFTKAEEFVVKIYSSSSSLKHVNDLRTELFHKISNPERLPPTQDALIQHLKRSQHQLMIWINASVAKPNLPLPEESGWTLSGDSLIPVLMTSEAVPSACVELVTCGCKTRKCNTGRCTCNKNKIGCTLGCMCNNDCSNPYQSEHNDSDME